MSNITLDFKETNKLETQKNFLNKIINYISDKHSNKTKVIDALLETLDKLNSNKVVTDQEFVKIINDNLVKNGILKAEDIILNNIDLLGEPEPSIGFSDYIECSGIKSDEPYLMPYPVKCEFVDMGNDLPHTPHTQAIDHNEVAFNKIFSANYTNINAVEENIQWFKTNNLDPASKHNGGHSGNNMASVAIYQSVIQGKKTLPAIELLLSAKNDSGGYYFHITNPVQIHHTDYVKLKSQNNNKEIFKYLEPTAYTANGGAACVRASIIELALLSGNKELYDTLINRLDAEIESQQDIKKFDKKLLELALKTNGISKFEFLTEKVSKIFDSHNVDIKSVGDVISGLDEASFNKALPLIQKILSKSNETEENNLKVSDNAGAEFHGLNIPFNQEEDKIFSIDLIGGDLD